MKCRLCNEYFYIKRSLLTLFKSKKEYVCNKCYKKYPISLSYEGIQLERYHCIIFSMFKGDYRIDYNAFIKEYSKVFISNYKRQGYKTFFFDYIDLNDYTLEHLDCISKLVESNIIILCLNIRK